MIDFVEKATLEDFVMGKGRSNSVHRRQRFEDFTGLAPTDASSFFFDLKLMLPDGMTQSDVHRARQTVERRLQRTVRKKDRIVWTADGFFLLLATTDPARAGAAAERVHQDVCALLAGHGATAPARRAPETAVPTPPKRQGGNHEATTA